MSVVEMLNVSVMLGGTDVLDDISMHVAEGEFVSILGPSGAGKTTILRLLTGALRQDRGAITCNGRPLAQYQQGFAFMPQRDALLPWCRILDNLTLGLEVQGMARNDARARVLPLLNDFGLTGFEQHYPAQLSGGMRQRAALLRTIVQARPVQLLDEPFGALDALTRAHLQEEVMRIHSALNNTVIMITHDVDEAVLLSDKIVMLTVGPLATVGEVLHVELPRPRDRLALANDADYNNYRQAVLRFLYDGHQATH